MLGVKLNSLVSMMNVSDVSDTLINVCYRPEFDLEKPTTRQTLACNPPGKESTSRLMSEGSMLHWQFNFPIMWETREDVS
jgi:hypothetical protein